MSATECFIDTVAGGRCKPEINEFTIEDDAVCHSAHVAPGHVYVSRFTINQYTRAAVNRSGGKFELAQAFKSGQTSMPYKRAQFVDKFSCFVSSLGITN